MIRPLFLLMILSVFLFPTRTFIILAEKGPNEANPIPFNKLPEFNIHRGKILYQRLCSFCHGEQKDGNGPNAYSLKVKPYDFSKKDVFQTGGMADMRLVIQNGGAHVGKSEEMPAFDHTLSPQEIIEIMDYLSSSK